MATITERVTDNVIHQERPSIGENSTADGHVMLEYLDILRGPQPSSTDAPAQMSQCDSGTARPFRKLEIGARRTGELNSVQQHREAVLVIKICVNGKRFGDGEEYNASSKNCG